MFNCEKCRKTTKQGERATMVVVQTRNRIIDGGVEIVREQKWCNECAGVTVPPPANVEAFRELVKGVAKAA